ncbi:MAG TPA: tRNA adenosine(34) deaminase TadA [Acidiferrobacteraceae bacterium]|nr:tRNA adenosine(34) deaminase TadA [Acidiferrobacteraceae bacterium]
MSALPDDAHYMRRALELASVAQDSGEVPVGALAVYAGSVIAEGWNQPIALTDPTAHAEILVLRNAGRALRNYRLPGVVIYVTLEPCAMCMVAMVHARVDRVVFGARDARAGAAGSAFDLAVAPQFNHRVAVTGGVCADACTEQLKAFFASRR